MSCNGNCQARNQEIRDNRAWLIFTGTLAFVGVATGIYCHHQMRKTYRMIGTAVNNISDTTVIDIRDEIINTAVEKAASHQAGLVVKKAIKDIEDDLTKQTQKQIREAVKTQYDKLSKMVSDTIAKEVSNIDGDEITEEVTEKAKEILVEKFNSKLDDLVDDYQRNLDNVGRIYQSVASAMAKTTSGDGAFNLK